MKYELGYVVLMFSRCQHTRVIKIHQLPAVLAVYDAGGSRSKQDSLELEPFPLVITSVDREALLKKYLNTKGPIKWGGEKCQHY